MALLPGGEAVTRDQLIARIQASRDARAEWIRRQVIEYDRVDILAEEVLGYKLQKFHLAMLHYSMTHQHSLHLAFRGAGKTTSVEIVRIIHAMVKDRNVRILISSKTMGFAKDILREVKKHLEENERFREVFGDLTTEDVWNDAEIVIAGRQRPMKEATITCVGIGGQLVGKHFDYVFGDDLVDEDNSRTDLGRTSTRTWYYKVLHPTMEPHTELHLFGTRYHFHDLYGHLQANEMEKCTQIIPALDSKGNSPWPEKYPASYFRSKRKDLGIIIFNSQYQCDTEAMKGEIFQQEWMEESHPLGSIPDTAKFYTGIDLAIRTDQQNDKFVMAGVAVDGPSIWVCGLFVSRLSFNEQTDRITKWWDTGMNGVIDPDRMVEMGIEVNAYQDAQYQNLRDRRPDIVLRPITTIKDKVVRAHRLAARFEGGDVRICANVYNAVVEALLLFPNDGKDIFDAIDLAIATAYQTRRRKRTAEVGLI